MKAVLTVAKRITQEGKITATTAEEIVIENVRRIDFDEAGGLCTLFLNDGDSEDILLQSGDENKGKQWFLLDIKLFQVPLKVEL